MATAPPVAVAQVVAPVVAPADPPDLKQVVFGRDLNKEDLKDFVDNYIKNAEPNRTPYTVFDPSRENITIEEQTDKIIITEKPHIPEEDKTGTIKPIDKKIVTTLNLNDFNVKISPFTGSGEEETLVIGQYKSNTEMQKLVQQINDIILVHEIGTYLIMDFLVIYNNSGNSFDIIPFPDSAQNYLFKIKKCNASIFKSDETNFHYI